MSSESRPAISVVIPALNVEATLDATLGALSNQEFDGDFEVVLVDDGSVDATLEIARSSSLGVRVFSQDTEGPGPARNRGVMEARGAHLAFLDADCVPEPRWLAAGVKALEEAQLVQGLVTASRQSELGPFDRSLWVLGPSPLYETANMFVTRALFDEIGGFVDWLPIRSGKPLAEDVWFGWRARRAGATIVFCQEAAVEHAVFPRSPRDYVAERFRAHYFPAIAKKVPELRREFLFAGLYLTPRSAAFDAALAGIAAATITGAWPWLVAALPYAGLVARRCLPHGRHAPSVAIVDGTADITTFAALVAGSVRWRSPVL